MAADPALEAASDMQDLVIVSLVKLGLDAHRANDVRACLQMAYTFGYDACQSDAMSGAFGSIGED